MSRKTLWIPLLSLMDPDGSSEHGVLLELSIEPGGYGASTEESLQRLRGHGLATALAAADAALAAAGLPPPSGRLCREPPVWLLSNPDPRLSNATGAALGIALGWLLYDERCPGQRLIASGQFEPVTSLTGARLAADPHLSARLRTALAFGPQATPLPFIVPAEITTGVETMQGCAELINALADLNIRVLPAPSLIEAVAACRRLSQGFG